jgi:hypothetical protein
MIFLDRWKNPINISIQHIKSYDQILMLFSNKRIYTAVKIISISVKFLLEDRLLNQLNLIITRKCHFLIFKEKST